MLKDGGSKKKFGGVAHRRSYWPYESIGILVNLVELYTHPQLG